jgi:rhodanese-related sulfurtransferase
MKNSILITLFFVVSLTISCKENKVEEQQLTKSEQQVVINKKLVATNFKTNIENKNVQLVDVRTPEEFKAGHIKNAGNINFYDTDFLTQMNKLDKNKPLYIYCRSGGRSGKAAAKLKEQGFKEVYDLQGGILDWEKNNFETEK